MNLADSRISGGCRICERGVQFVGESAVTALAASSRGVWGHAPPGNF